MRVQEFQFNVDLMQAILWQYNDAEKLQSLLQSKQNWYDSEYEQFWNDWAYNVFDLRTADGFGQAVWSIILGLPLTIEPSTSPSSQIWGFEDYYKNFERGNFYPAGSGISLTQDERRMVLQLRYFQLVTRGAVPEINRMLNFVFGELGKVYVIDNHDMTITYKFEFIPTSRLLYLLYTYDLLPRPAAVEVNVSTTDRDVFGFGDYYVNFERGGFANA